MANGQDLGEINYQKFLTWIETQTTEDYREMVYRGQLNRRLVAKGADIGNSALKQNPKVKERLFQLEEDLRARSVLPPIAYKSETSKDIPESKQLDQAELKRERQGVHLRRLEQRVVELEAENDALRQRLSRFDALSSALSDIGRLPR
ncbi:VPA1267 family protein [Aliagarivorans marinus]|uniref:VPA1267 family protein n=1 Tax=Aliagarivorans marinus TaxID=561965 RepID=UPI00047EEBA7|nr:VPA1267 family protein [Aliagarivorans marinus]